MTIYFPKLVIKAKDEEFSLRVVVCENDCFRLEVKDKYNGDISPELQAKTNIIINDIVYFINVYNITRDKKYLERIEKILTNNRGNYV